MIQQADPGAVQYGSVIPQLATHMSALQIGNGSVSLLSDDGLAIIPIFIYICFF